MGKKKILLIDDELDFGILFKNFFSKKGFEVFLSNTLADGLDMFQRIRPDIVLLDNNLPDGLGWEHTPALLEQDQQLKLILISAYRHDNSLSRRFPSVTICEKPITLSELSRHFQ